MAADRAPVFERCLPGVRGLICVLDQVLRCRWSRVCDLHDRVIDQTVVRELEEQ